MGRCKAQPQPTEGISLTRQLKREDGRLDPRRPAIELERQVRAYQPWPGSFIELGGDGSSAERLKVWAASLPDQPVPGDPGALVPIGETLGLVTADGVLQLDEVQPAGKRRMRGAEYRRGRRS